MVKSRRDDKSVSRLKIAVTGSSGFVGKHLQKACALSGITCIPLARGLFTRPQHLPESDQSLSDQLVGVYSLVHLAGLAHWNGHNETEKSARFYEANVAFSNLVLSAAITAGVKRFVFLSSVKAVAERSGNDLQGDVTVDENLQPAPEDHYGRSKLEAEVSLRQGVAHSDMELIILRPPLIYGVGQKGNMARIVKAVASGIPLPFATVMNQRSLISVDNLCDAILTVVRNPSKLQGSYFLKDTDISTAELCRQIARAHNRPSRLYAVPPSILRSLAKVVGMRESVEKIIGNLVVDGRAFNRDYHWEPKHTLEEVLIDIAQSSTGNDD